MITGAKSLGVKERGPPVNCNRRNTKPEKQKLRRGHRCHQQGCFGRGRRSVTAQGETWGRCHTGDRWKRADSEAGGGEGHDGHLKMNLCKPLYLYEQHKASFRQRND